MKQETINVLLVDDHILFREGIRRVLEMESGINVIGECGDGEEAIAKAKSLQPDVILMDINMPGINGVEATTEIMNFAPDSRIIILSIHDDEHYVYRTLRAGASGYLLKEIEGGTLVDAIRKVYNGGSYIHSKATGKLINEFRRLAELEEEFRSSLMENDVNRMIDVDKWELLSPREREVLHLMSEGNNNRTIGELLFISEKTVKNHVSSILMKLEVDDRTQAVVRSVKSGWISL